jgi:phenylalanyl-tRNA synthetase beta chain
MRVPLEWLADYVDIDLPTDELARRLTLAGLKIEAVERIGEDWQDVVVGKVIELEPHPRSNKPLWVAKVDLGDRVITVVTGAQNVHLGDLAPVVLVGGLLPHGPDGDPMIITAKPMAGITSEGMLASERELGISDEHSGIYILPAQTPVGVPLKSVMGGDVLEIETNPNRPDTLSIIGVAREVAAITEQQVSLPDLDAITGPVEWLDEASIPVSVQDPQLCPRYSALRIEGVAAEESPAWLARRLEAAGMRPINLLVDITNYVMLEYGQPMHAFDSDRLRGGRIVVRRATDGERLRTLDGIERLLTSEMLVIADGERAVAIAGVMGGEESEITDQTRSIVLESATFDPISVRSTALELSLRTESSSRFEKGLPPEQTVLGAQRYLQLLAQITGAPLKVAQITDEWIGPPEPRVIPLRMEECNRLLGVTIAGERAAEMLNLLGFEVTGEGDVIEAVVPFWRRVDMQTPEDLVEEVARLIGYDMLPSTLPLHTVPPPELPPELHWQDVVRERLLGIGASELVTGTLTSPATMARLLRPGSNGHEESTEDLWERLVVNPAGVHAEEALTQPVPLVNPPTKDRTVLRMTLLPSLLDVVAHNLKHTNERLAFFEINRTFFRRPQDLPYERRTLSIALSGQRQPTSWQVIAPGSYSFYDLKGMLETVLDGLQIEDWSTQPASHPSLHPGRAAAIRLKGRDIAYFGELHPEVAAAFEIDSSPVQVAEVDLDSLFSAASDIHTFRPLSRQPAARRDIAVVVDNDVPAAEIVRVIREAAGQLLDSIQIFDVYTGSQVSPGDGATGPRRHADGGAGNRDHEPNRRWIGTDRRSGAP